jgi:16S rRNA (cytosine1402-N4)-methyltransferase
MPAQDPAHTPVLLEQAVSALNIQPNGIYVDATFGRGGYARQILSADDSIHLWAIDRDPSTADAVKRLQTDFPDRFHFILGRFGDIETLLCDRGCHAVDGIVMDLGVSSPQLDTPERGFSFRMEGPLDMRMGKSDTTAADIINTWAADDLADLFYQYGEERHSRRIARAIANRRQESEFSTTTDLADVIRNAMPGHHHRIDPATRVFQALRIAVNNELDELDQALEAAVDLLNHGGRLVVVSFHSLEDRPVKHFMKSHSELNRAASRHLPPMPDDQVESPRFKIIRPFPVTPSKAEQEENPRARSAKMRVAERIRPDKANKNALDTNIGGMT